MKLTAHKLDNGMFELRPEIGTPHLSDADLVDGKVYELKEFEEVEQCHDMGVGFWVDIFDDYEDRENDETRTILRPRKTTDKPEQSNQVTLNCMVCHTEFIGDEPQMCCSGRDCGCMGMPTDPIVCSTECYDKLTNRTKETIINIDKPEVEGERDKQNYARIDFKNCGTDYDYNICPWNEVEDQIQIAEHAIVDANEADFEEFGMPSITITPISMTDSEYSAFFNKIYKDEI